MKKYLFLFLALALVACGREGPGKPKAGHVVFIGLDGWASDGIRLAPVEDLPNIHGLMEHGSWTLAKRAVMPSASAINWASMVNGLPTEMHGFDQWNSTRGSIPSTSDNGYGIPPTIFTILREQRPEAVSGCLYDWDGIGAVVDTLAMDWHSFVETFTSSDEVIVPVEDYTRIATGYIQEHKPAFFFLYYGTIDEAGHVRGWYSDDYMERQRIVDAAVGQVIQTLKDAGIYDDTIIVLSADHGGIDRKHGGFTLEELETPLIVAGKGIRQGFEITEPMMQYDTPAVLADLLGLRIPADWRGRPFPEIYGK